MASLLLVISTAVSFLAAQSSIIGNLLTKWNNLPSAEEKELIDEKQKLKNDQLQYSMMDDFAKYSKIQRKINTIDEQLNNSIKARNTIQTKVILNYGPQVVCTLILLLLTLYYRRTPLFKLPDRIDLTPFNFIISYPNERNFVSFHFWIMCCNVVARLLKV